MTKKYTAMRESFEEHIAKQQGLEGIPKAVLATQVFAMNENLDYIDEKLQTKWVEWRSASSQQIKKDAKICEDFTHSDNTGHDTLSFWQASEWFSEAIRNQEDQK